MEKICKNCRWWHFDDPKYGGECENKKVIDGNYKTNEGCIIVDNNYGLGFFTGPNFGCIHWEKKDENKLEEK